MFIRSRLISIIRNNGLPIAMGALLVLFAVMNGLLLKQNLQLRSELARLAPDTLKAGDTLEPFTAAGLHGSSIDVKYAQNAPKRVFLFFSPSCPYSRQQFAYWNSVIRQAPARGLQVVALAKDSEDKSKIEEFLKIVGCPTETDGFQVALIPRQIGAKYKFAVTPTTVIVSSNGVTEYAWNGAWTVKDLAAASASLGFDVLHQ